MIRRQRRAHARVFLVLAPLLTAALVYALALRMRTARVLRSPAIVTEAQEAAP
jgi:hypothetical protein